MTPERLTELLEHAHLLGTRDALRTLERTLAEVTTLDEARAVVALLLARAEAEVGEAS